MISLLTAKAGSALVNNRAAMANPVICLRACMDIRPVQAVTLRVSPLYGSASNTTLTPGLRPGPTPVPPLRGGLTDELPLLRINEVGAAVLLPASFGALAAGRFFLAVADGTDARRRDSLLDQCLLGGIGAILAQRQVVLDGSALVAVALDDESHARMLLQELRIRIDDGFGLWRDFVAVVGEEYVLHVLREQACVAVVGS